ncbi:regulatory protein RecX [Parasediminibacterium sp. JCM 36343]|uniref:regulatory protein RecX n=1 Tax=Parasediminibacterium sp. JCM 36343 TaxID=3374279 RepID=UPI00397CFF2E
MKQSLTPEKAFQKIKAFCAYQERGHREVARKLYSYGLYKKDVEILLSQLIEEGFLNEERFAIAFAGGRFRIKHWGRVKIKYELQQKGVSNFCIILALKAIDEEEYIPTLQQLATKKWESLKGEHYIARQGKTTAYLLQKGFEHTFVSKAIAAIMSKP